MKLTYCGSNEPKTNSLVLGAAYRVNKFFLAWVLCRYGVTRCILTFCNWEDMGRIWGETWVWGQVLFQGDLFMGSPIIYQESSGAMTNLEVHIVWGHRKFGGRKNPTARSHIPINFDRSLTWKISSP